MSASLDELVKMEGVLLAFEYAPDGKCLTRENISPEMAAMAAKFCATVTMQFNTLASAFSALSEQQWTPQHCWVYQGGDYTVITGSGGFPVVCVGKSKANPSALVKQIDVCTPTLRV